MEQINEIAKCMQIFNIRLSVSSLEIVLLKIKSYHCCIMKLKLGPETEKMLIFNLEIRIVYFDKHDLWRACKIYTM